MRTLSFTIISLFLVVPGLALPDYFPLNSGNRWVLETGGADPQILSIEVGRARTINGKTYYFVQGYGSHDQWLRHGEDGALYALRERSGREAMVAHPSPTAPPYQTRLGGCEQTVEPAAEPGRYEGPNFRYEQAALLRYLPDSCRDAGIVHEAYAAGIGLVQRSVTTIRGELTYDLVYARVDGQAIVGKSGEIVLHDQFGGGSHGWLPGFSDYNLRTGDLRMLAELRPLPEEAGASGSAYYVQGMNRPDDLFMFLKKPVEAADGLEPGQEYRLSFDIRFASNAPSGCAGVGGAPGEGVYLKAGASLDEPVPAVDTASDVRLGLDKGQQASGGREAGLVGTIANGTPCEGTVHPYVRLRKSYAHAPEVKTDERGSLWLVVGTDSAFEGLTGLYYESVTVRIHRAAFPAGTP